jgi:ABC-type methionine transport system ATPase subunit
MKGRVEMAKRRVRLTFSAELYSEPIIYNIGQQFNLVTNICQADLVEDKGWVILELDGKEKSIDDAITWAISKGVRVNTISS